MKLKTSLQVWLAFLISPVFILPLQLDKSEQDLRLSGHLQQSLQPLTTQWYYQETPVNPISRGILLSYQEKDLVHEKGLIKAQTRLRIANVEINQKGQTVFRLEDDSYVLASQQLIYDDIVWSRTSIKKSFWTKGNVKAYESPYVSGVKIAAKRPQPYSKVIVTEKAQTQSGIYYLAKGFGWIAEEHLSATETRMAKVQKWLREHENENISVYIKQLDTGQTAEINADETMYAASVAKLSILYYVQEQVNKGNISLQDTLKYTEKVNDFKGAYDPFGSSVLPLEANNKSYTVDELIKAVAQKSDNVASNMLGYYIAHQYDKDFYHVIRSAGGHEWDMSKREITAKTAAKMLEVLYQQDSNVLTYLSKTDFDDQRISKNIKEKVAHKIGDAYDFKHDVALIYADEPYILAIMTDKSSYEDITKIADAVHAILK